MKLLKSVAGLLLLFTLILIIGGYLLREPEIEINTTQEDVESRTPAAESHSETPAPVLPPLGRDGTQGKTKIAIIIDDIGFRLAPVTELLKIDAPIAFAILPHTPQSAVAAEMVHMKGHEILLHLPMEPHAANQKPGTGALFRTMTGSEIRKQLKEDIEAVPYLVGVNNHMGSAFMEDEERLQIVLKELQQRGLYFIDSRTTPKSRAKAVAVKTGIRFAARRLFLDNEMEQAVIFRNLLKHLENNNDIHMIIIGHPYPGTIKALGEAVPLLQSRGIRFVMPSELVEVIGGGLKKDRNE